MGVGVVVVPGEDPQEEGGVAELVVLLPDDGVAVGGEGAVGVGGPELVVTAPTEGLDQADAAGGELDFDLLDDARGEYDVLSDGRRLGGVGGDGDVDVVEQRTLPVRATGLGTAQEALQEAASRR